LAAAPVSELLETAGIEGAAGAAAIALMGVITRTIALSTAASFSFSFNLVTLS
jgi:hypothetical protein